MGFEIDFVAKENKSFLHTFTVGTDKVIAPRMGLEVPVVDKVLELKAISFTHKARLMLLFQVMQQIIAVKEENSTEITLPVQLGPILGFLPVRHHFLARVEALGRKTSDKTCH